MKRRSGETENEEDIKCSHLRNNKLNSRQEHKNKAIEQECQEREEKQAVNKRIDEHSFFFKTRTGVF